MAEPLRALIARHGLTARKGLGQHFLLDMNVTRRVARAAGDVTGVDVIEVGPGPGGLTRALLETPARRVIAVEIDRRCVAALAELAAESEGRLEIVEADALQVDPRAVSEAPRAVVANLPYNVGTRLLVDWLEHAEAYVGFTLMLQREVVDRLTAAPGGKDYGRLSVIAQWRTEARRAFDVSARAFTPPPKVDSAVVTLSPRPRAADAPDWRAMMAVTAAAFGQRRKMLRGSLRSLGVDVGALLDEAGIPAEARAEVLGVGEFERLARAWRRLSSGRGAD